MPSTTNDPQGSANSAEGSGIIRACVDKVLPPELAGDALATAINERRDNIVQQHGAPANPAAHDGPAMAVVAKRLWKPGRTLRVRFMDKPPLLVRQKIEQYAHEWEQHANIKFVFGKSANAEIRITCTPNDGSWSYLGTEALDVSSDEPTMNYGWFDESTDDEEFRRTTLHEFGHALGCIHEHMHPKGGIPWNKEATYRWYQDSQGWTRKDVDEQLFFKYSSSLLNASAYDKDSIMHYPVPKELTLNGFEVGWNMTLSPQDKVFIGKMYPPKP